MSTAQRRRRSWLGSGARGPARRPWSWLSQRSRKVVAKNQRHLVARRPCCEIVPARRARPMAYPLARVWDEPHACVNVCGVVLSIRDEMTAKQQKRRLELELRDGTHAVTCVFWGAAAEATATTVARLDVVSVDVRDAARDGAGLACQCRSAAVSYTHLTLPTKA